VAFPNNIASRRKHLRGSATKRSGAHNVHPHPSGVAEPSHADELITTRLRDSLSLIDVRVLDHLLGGFGCVTRTYILSKRMPF
jgi:DNA repair protein RadC